MRFIRFFSIAGIDLDEVATARLLAKYPVQDEYQVRLNLK